MYLNVISFWLLDQAIIMADEAAPFSWKFCSSFVAGYYFTDLRSLEDLRSCRPAASAVEHKEAQVQVQHESCCQGLQLHH